MDELADFKNLLETHAKIINREREVLARRIANVIAASGNKPLTAIDVTIAMARIDTIFDEFYGKDEGDEWDSHFGLTISAEVDRARQLAFDQSNAIIEEELKDEPDLIPLVRLE
jgi:hypothetical protein